MVPWMFGSLVLTSSVLEHQLAAPSQDGKIFFGHGPSKIKDWNDFLGRLISGARSSMIEDRFVNHSKCTGRRKARCVFGAQSSLQHVEKCRGIC